MANAGRLGGRVGTSDNKRRFAGLTANAPALQPVLEPGRQPRISEIGKHDCVGVNRFSERFFSSYGKPQYARTPGLDVPLAVHPGERRGSAQNPYPPCRGVNIVVNNQCLHCCLPMNGRLLVFHRISSVYHDTSGCWIIVVSLPWPLGGNFWFPGALLPN